MNLGMIIGIPLLLMCIVISLVIVIRDIPQLIKDSKTAKQLKSSNKVDTTNELKKCKKLLDKGAITQEEFDAKKKELLGL